MEIDIYVFSWIFHSWFNVKLVSKGLNTREQPANDVRGLGSCSHVVIIMNLFHLFEQFDILLSLIFAYHLNVCLGFTLDKLKIIR